MITGLDFDTVFHGILLQLKHAAEYSPRGMRVKEILNSQFTILDPYSSVLSVPARKLNKNYIKKEIEWYLSGTRSIDAIKSYSKMWEQIAENGEVNSAYGWQIFTQKTPENISQFDWVINSFTKDRDTRQAVININQVMHKYQTKDFCCTLAIQYFIRENNLHSIVTMRSNDIIYGAGNDVPFFCYLQHLILVKLREQEQFKNLAMGVYHHNAGSMHIYERHYEMMEDCLRQYNTNFHDLYPRSKNIVQLMEDQQ